MTDVPLKVLFVEQDVADQASVERFFRSFALGYRVDTVNTATEAVRRLHGGEYDIVLIDYRFNDGTAFDLLNQIGDTPAIFLTGGGQEEIAALALKRGAYDYLIKDASHSYLMLLPGTIQKVMVRKEAERALKESEARYKDLLDTVLDTYLCINEQGSILLINRAGARQLGCTVSALLGQPYFNLIHADDVEMLKKEFLIAASRPDEVHQLEYRQIRKDGRVMTVAADIRAQPQRGRLFPVIRILCREVDPDRKNGAVEPRRSDARAVAVPVSVSPVAPAAGAADPAPAGAAVTPVPVETAAVPVEVPVLPAPKPAAAAPAPPLREVAGEFAGTERILVVDDEPVQRALAARMLTKLGYRVVTAESGRAAIEMMKGPVAADGDKPEGSPFDLVITDMTMEKGFDGLETYRQISQLFPGQKCLIMSGYCESDRVREAQALGAGKFIGKPYTFRTIGQAVREELDRKQ